jgi:thiol-disulfide isomerase/thioredoxin
MRRRLAAALLAALAVGGCGGGQTVGTVANGGGLAGGSGTVEQIPPAQRTTAISVRGTTPDDTVVDTSTYRGHVVVLNTWGSWCGPCNAEAPALQKASVALAPKGVKFVGINIRDDDASLTAFERKFGVTYPSVRYDGGAVVLQLKGKAVATPTTIVLDRQGRVAARVTVQVDTSTLTGLVQDVLKESS